MSSRGPEQKITVEDLRKSLKNIQTGMEALATRVSEMGARISSQADRLAVRTETLGDSLAGEPRDAVVGTLTSSVPKSVQNARLMAQAEAGVAGLTLNVGADGSAQVSIGQTAPFRLARQVATLLALLAADDAPTKDDLVRWKPTLEIADALSKFSGRDLPVSTVHALVYKLRRRLEQAGINPQLVQSRRDKGVRFALRANGAAADWSEAEKLTTSCDREPRANGRVHSVRHGDDENSPG